MIAPELWLVSLIAHLLARFISASVPAYVADCQSTAQSQAAMAAEDYDNVIITPHTGSQTLPWHD